MAVTKEKQYVEGPQCSLTSLAGESATGELLAAGDQQLKSSFSYQPMLRAVRAPGREPTADISSNITLPSSVVGKIKGSRKSWAGLGMKHIVRSLAHLLGEIEYSEWTIQTQLGDDRRMTS